MNNTGKAYNNIISKLAEIDKSISLWQSFLSKMISDRAVKLTLVMEEVKIENENYLEEEKKQYESPISGLGSLLYFGVPSQQKDVVVNPSHIITEQLATQICRGVLQELTFDRNRLLSQLGLIVKTEQHF